MPRRILAAALALCLLLSIPAAAANGSTYTDVPPDDWAVSSIEKATEYGLMEGVGGGRFGYGRVMDRASFAAILCRMFGWEAASPDAPSFSDVQPDAWYYSAVETALRNGAIEPGVYFNPGDDISREDMAVMLMRALDYDQLAASLEHAPLPFPDVTSNRGYIALAYRFGIINGIPMEDGSLHFLPTRSSNREVAAAMLVRTYERLQADIDWLHGFYAFSSYGQIGFTDRMDGVSVGWAALVVDENGTPRVSQTSAGGNSWVKPQDASIATDYFQGNGKPYHLSVFASATDSVTLSDGGKTSTLAAALAAPERYAQAVSAIVALAGDYDGITIDFEGLRTAYKDAFTGFMTALRAALPPDKALYVCVQPPDWYDGYDYHSLGEICDKVILMAHDYQDTNIPAGYVGTAKTDNPVTPFYKIFSALSAITDPDTGVADRSKIALAVSFASAGLRIDEDGKLLETTVYAPGTDTLARRLAQEGTERGWSDVYRNPYAVYTTEDGGRYRVWYEDERSVMEKIHLAQMFGIGGVSLWRLGTIPNSASGEYDVWSAILEARS